MARLEVKARVGADVTPLERAFKKAEGSGARFAGQLKSHIASAFSVGAAIGFARSMANAAAEIKDMAQQMQVTTTEAQRIRYEAELTGNKFTDIRMNLNRLGESRKRAAEGDEKQLALFKMLGVAYEDLQNPLKKDIDLLKQIGAAINTGDASQVSAFKGIFGVEAFKTISAIQGLADTVKDLPKFWEPGEVETIDKASKRFEAAFMSLQARAAGPLAEVAEPLEEMLTDGGLFTGFGKLWKRLLPTNLIAGLASKAAKGAGFGGLFELDPSTDPISFDKGEKDPLFDPDAKRKKEMEEALAALSKVAANYEYQKLDAAGRRLAIEKEIADLERRRNTSSDELEKIKLSEMILSKQTALLAFKSKPDSAARDLLNATPNSDSLGRIGGSTGVAARTSERHLSDIRRELQALNRRVDRGIRLEDAL